MKILKSKKLIQITKTELSSLTIKFQKTIIDIGTGNGRFVYKNAIDNPGNFYIGVDPSEKSMREYSTKSNRKKLTNLLYAVGSIEIFPKELTGLADEIHINFPWGTLLEKIVYPNSNFIGTLKNTLKNGGKVIVIFGYRPELEPGETSRLSLPEINEEYIRTTVVPVFENEGFHLVKLTQIPPNLLKNYETTWAKKIHTRPDRPMFEIQMNL